MNQKNNTKDPRTAIFKFFLGRKITNMMRRAIRNLPANSWLIREGVGISILRSFVSKRESKIVVGLNELKFLKTQVYYAKIK